MTEELREQLKQRAEAAASAVFAARQMVRELEAHIAELTSILTNFRSHYNWDVELRQREAALLAREDRCTIRERELDEREKK